MLSNLKSFETKHSNFINFYKNNWLEPCIFVKWLRIEWFNIENSKSKIKIWLQLIFKQVRVLDSTVVYAHH